MVSLRGPGLKIFAAVLALVLLGAGVYLNFFHSQGFVKTTATIVDVEAVQEADSNTYRATVEYTVDGKTYRQELDQQSSSYAVGKTVEVLYNPANPAEVHAGGILPIILMIVGAVLLAFAVISTVTEKKAQKEVRARQEATGRSGYSASRQGQERELYFLTDLGTIKYGHRLEDKDRRVLYEAKVTKFSAVSASEFDFIDHVNGTTTPHLVGKEEDSQWSTMFIDGHHTFELDGVDVFRHLKDNGVSVETSYAAGGAAAVGINYRILRNGVEMARAQSSSQYVHEEDAEQHRVAASIPAKGFFRVWTREENLDLLFITLMAFGRTDASDDNGGNMGALIGTLRGGR
ncbi:MAG: DUF3592 domain-containing protein [Oscillospiraceae bacterium]|nr:DUF3592 domain-containing protein [Oscillospiraceae bacterium]